MKTFKDKCKATGKVIFTSQAQADRRAEKYYDIKRSYFCDKCGGWHLTSQEGKSRKKKIVKQDTITNRMNQLKNILKKKA